MNRTRFAWLVFASSLVIYGLSLAPTLGVWNSPAWVVNSLFFGLPYAPGNLLYLVISAFTGRICQWFFEPAAAINAISMLSGAATAALCFVLIDRLVERAIPLNQRTKGIRWLVAAGALFVSTMPSIWMPSLVAGPESFNLFLVVFSLWLLFRVHEGSKNSGVLVLFWSYLLGLAFSHNYVFIFGMAGLVLFLWAGREVRRAMIENLGPMLFLFFFGLSLYIYIWLRPSLDVGLGQSPEFLSGDFWNYVFHKDALQGALARKADFFLYQVPLFLSYLKLQAGHWGIALAALLVFHYGLVRMFAADRKVLAGILVLLAFSALAVLWLANPRLGPHQALDKVPELWMHESRDLDHLFVFTYLLFGSLVVIGLCFLKRDSTALVERFMKRMQIDGGKLHRLTNGGILTVLLAAPLSFIPVHWHRVDMSGFYAVRDLAANLLGGIEKNAILFVSNDTEYYPIIYVNKALAKQSDNIVSNYLWMSEKTYLKDLRKSSPPMPLTYSEVGIDRLRTVRLEKAMPLRAGDLQVVYPENTVLDVREQALIDIIRANGFNRPVYFSHQVPPGRLAGLQRYVALQGLAVQMFEQDPLVGADSLNYWREDEKAIAVDIRRTKGLLWLGYRFHTTSKDIEHHPEDHGWLLNVYARIHELLGRAMIARDRMEEASENFRQCVFFSSNYLESLHSFAVILAWAGEYESSKEFMNYYFKQFPADPLKWAGLAKIALANTDSLPATEMLLESIKVDPDFLLGFQKLIRLYDSMDKKVMAAAFLSRWAGRHSNDEEAVRLWENYSTTETLPPGWPE